MSGKKNKEKKVENNESSPEALFTTIRQQQADLSAFSGQTAMETELAQMLSKVLTIVSDLATVSKNHMRMTAELNVKTDTLGDNVNEILKQIPSFATGSENMTPVPQPSQRSFQPVKSLDELEFLNSKSCEPDFVRETILYFSRLHGKGRFVGRGLDVCHQIINSFFNPEFLIGCSWTGVGRNVKKIPFMRYEKVIELFFKVVLNSDPEFSKSQTEAFLHQCLRNAKQRVNNSGGKKPASRKRKLAGGLPESSMEEADEGGETGETEELDETGEYDETNGFTEEEGSSELSLKIEILDEAILE